MEKERKMNVTVEDEDLGKKFVDALIGEEREIHKIHTRIFVQEAWDTFGIRKELKGIRSELAKLNKTLISLYMKK